ncbi:MAG: heavy-metal-associated domain-containing protein [Rhodobacterales bacterium]|nr:heavy-metal-associated domain-containing protein [Rhodobacterales bacterium]
MTRFSIPDMSCGHCKSAVEAAITALPGTNEVMIDLRSREAEVTGEASPAAVIAALDAAGYPARVTG